MPPPVHLYRHNELVINRPYAFDVDRDGWLWEGTSQNRLMGHKLGTGELRVIDMPAFEKHVAYSVFAWHGKLVMILGESPFYLVYDPASGACEQRIIPPAAGTSGAPITWYGERLPGDALALFDRRGRQVLVLDSPEAQPRIAACPYAADLAYASLAGDGLLYAFAADPARVIRFDPAAMRFVDERPLPWATVGVSGRVEHEGVLYCADSSGGRILPLDLATQRWLEPIHHPDHGKVFGYIGTGIACAGKAYFSLSTYTARSRLDTRTGQIIVPEGVPLSVDRWTYRFMERMLVMDLRTREFDYLVAPEQPDGMPLLCYSWTDGLKLVVTGLVIPFATLDAGKREPGSWLVLETQ